jgi:hypothetical protein
MCGRGGISGEGIQINAQNQFATGKGYTMNPIEDTSIAFMVYKVGYGV